MVFQDISKVMMGQLSAEEFVAPLSASIMFFIITMGVGWSLRALNKMLTPEPIKTHVANFLATLEMCAYFFENNFIYKNFGSIWLFIAVVIECFIANRTFFGASENPCHAFTQMLENKISATSAIVSIVVQALAGVASYRFARMVWSLDMVPDHRDRYMETVCASDLNVAFLIGFGIELGATLIDTWMGRQTLMKMSMVDELIKLSVGSLMIVLGINMTGMYFNPAMASGHTFGCHGTEVWEHLFVYWAGPFLGCYVATVIDQMVHIDVVQAEKESKKKAS
ncbi:aquaporin-11-like [Ruditapes philippinarum]|uniref:aquaporin-11-like n=1 Tax=Ruditapes philippinarum TaxID=129788 RepID=UPI00295A7903|nr:aquaporin-11-like [Ruditapes philippinarum]XP_060575095.1 aquaporin-11-like [Ruditapes philippinarum]